LHFGSIKEKHCTERPASREHPCCFCEGKYFFHHHQPHLRADSGPALTNNCQPQTDYTLRFYAKHHGVRKTGTPLGFILRFASANSQKFPSERLDLSGEIKATDCLG
jgi:hypothetical protein